MNGNLIVISGPSGVGKGTICADIIKRDDKITLSVSATTRAPREGELDGVHYHFLSKEDFLARVERGEFYEYANVHEHYYGTLKAAVLAMRERGFDVILEIDVQGALQIKAAEPDAILIFILPPDIGELSRRLRERKTESEEQIALRLKNAERELAYAPQYDYRVVNGELAAAEAEVLKIIRDERAAAQ